MNVKKVLFIAVGAVTAGAVLYAVGEMALRRYHGGKSAKFDRAAMATLKHLGWPTGIGTLYEPHGNGEFTLQIGEDLLLVFDFTAQGLSLVSCSGPGYRFAWDGVPKELQGMNPTYNSFWRWRNKAGGSSGRGAGDSY